MSAKCTPGWRTACKEPHGKETACKSHMVMDIAEADQIGAARNGDSAAFERLVAGHQARLHAYCYRMLGGGRSCHGCRWRRTTRGGHLLQGRKHYPHPP
jgi:hypothetical protein